MKSSSFVIKAMALAVATFTLLSVPSCKDSGANTNNGSDASAGGSELSGATLPIAYINVDSVLVNYEYAKSVNDKLTKKLEDNRLSLNQKTKKLEKEMQDFQQKANNNIFLSQERMQQEYNRIMKQQQELEETAQRLQVELGMEQQKENMQIADSVMAVVKLINETSKYEVIFNMREYDNIILANPKYDITQQVLDLLNQRYKSAAKN